MTGISYLFKKRLKFTESVLPLLDNGIVRVKSSVSEILQIGESYAERILRKDSVFIQMTLMNSNAQRKFQRKTYVIVESLPENKRTILSDRNNFLEPSILHLFSLRILLQELILIEKGCKPFWNTHSKETSEKLWLPTEIELHGSDLTLLNQSLKNQEEHLRSLIMRKENPEKKNFQRTSLLSPMYTTATKWDNEDTPVIIKNKKIRIKPSNTQRKIFKEWFGTYRFVYNKCLEYSKNPTSLENLGDLFNDNPYHYIDFFRMRDMIVTSKGNHFQNGWEKNTPKDIRAGAVKEFCTSCKTNMKKLKQHKILRFNIKNKSRKNPQQSITIPHSAFKMTNGTIDLYTTKVKGVKVGKKSKKKPIDITMDSKLVYDGLNFYLLIPKSFKVKEKEDNNKVVALDPGVRTFQTCYSEDEIFKFHIDSQKSEKIKEKIRLLEILFKERSLDLSKDLSKRNIKKKILNLSFTIKNLVNECHWKTARYLIKNYNDILLPTFESQEMVKNNKLNRKTKSNMLELSHYKFKIRLKEKAKEFKSFRIHDVNESYTSKTCSCCGFINSKLGSSKVFYCTNCNGIIDRDVNGARNIFIKHSV